MFDKLLKISGAIALYGCASMFLASLFVGAYLTWAWKIDKEKRVKMLAIAQGFELKDLRKAVEDRVAEMSYDEVLQIRAKRLREEEFKAGGSEKSTTELLLADEKKIDAKLKSIADKQATFDKYIADYMKNAKATGLAEETRLIENAEADQAKAIILKLVKEYGAMERVLTMLLAMEEKKRGEILYAMQQEEELKELCNILQKIGNGEPMVNAIENAKKESAAAGAPAK